MSDISKSKFIFYYRKELFDAVCILNIPLVIVDVICDYGYKTKYDMYHICQTDYQNHDGIYNSICYGDYMIELVDDVCYIKNVFTNELIKQQNIQKITKMISDAKTCTRYSHWIVPISSFDFQINNKKVYCSQHYNLVFSIDFENQKCFFDENIGGWPNELYYIDDSKRESVCDDIGHLKHNLFMEIKQKTLQMLKKTKLRFYDGSTIDYNLTNTFNVDDNNCLNIIFYIRYDNNEGSFNFHHYVLEYDLKKKIIIRYYKIKHGLNANFIFNKDYLNISHVKTNFIDRHCKERINQTRVYKKRVL